MGQGYCFRMIPLWRYRMNYKAFIVLAVLTLLVTGQNVSPATLAVESLLPKDGIPKGWTLVEGPRLTRKTL
jgi:hypothetical protein